MSTTYLATREQQAVIDSGLTSQRVIACAGSGKTATAVRRLVAIRSQMGASRGYVALFSYSNVAIDTFRREYSLLRPMHPGLSNRVVIATVDSFLASAILLPHASQVMGCACQPFLVQGHEPFLRGFTISNGSYPVGIEHLQVLIDSQGKIEYAIGSNHGPPKSVSRGAAESAIHRLGKTGAYTHELARYWALRTLQCHGRLVGVLARRFPFILIDEAQDVGMLHGALLFLLRSAGVTMSLIGDPNQAIYSFAGADGSYLRTFDPGGTGVDQVLSENRRSVQAIVDVATAISGNKVSASRPPPGRKHGAFVLRYKESKISQLLPTFGAMLQSAGYMQETCAVLCRGTELAQHIAGRGTEMGQGATECFARAAVCRDGFGDVYGAFESTLDGVLRLLDSPPIGLRRSICNPGGDAKAVEIRRLVWAFVRSETSGIPSAALSAHAQWHPLLKRNAEALLLALKGRCGLAILTTWKHNLTARALGSNPLLHKVSSGATVSRIPVKTVHQAKGESLDAVLYVAKARDVTSLLRGPCDEEGRIGYVAVTRARDLLMLAVPDSTPSKHVAALVAKGFVIEP